jgi:hypothetical protein
MRRKARMHVTAVGLESYVLGKLTEDQASITARHLSECAACAQLLHETLVFIRQLREQSQRAAQAAGHPERRKHPRIPTNDPARLRILQPVVLEPQDVQILDTSREGLRLSLNRPLEPGALVQIRLKHLLVLAEVRYCHPHGDQFHAGVAIYDTLALGAEPL